MSCGPFPCMFGIEREHFLVPIITLCYLYFRLPHKTVGVKYLFPSCIM